MSTQTTTEAPEAPAPAEVPLTEMQWRDQEVRKIEAALTTKKDELKKVLPTDIDPDKFARVVLTSVTMTPDLLYADRRSLFSACMKAAQDGLFPDGRECVLNIYNCNVAGRNEPDCWVPMVQYMPMVKGILKIMRNTGDILKIDAAAVYEKDVFNFKRGDDPKIVHEPYLGTDDPGQVIACYVIIKMENGETQREVMPRRDIEKVRAASKSGDGKNSPWTKWYDQMGIKAVIKRTAKLMETSSERLERVLQNDNDALGMDFARSTAQPAALPQSTIVAKIEAPKVPGRPSRLAALMAAQAAAKREPVPVAAGRDDGAPFDQPYSQAAE